MSVTLPRPEGARNVCSASDSWLAALRRLESRRTLQSAYDPR